MTTHSTAFSPFADESAAVQIGELKLENRLDRVSVYGSVDLTRDRAGLSQALALKAIVDATVAALQGQPLPESIQAEAPGSAPNPFR